MQIHKRQGYAIHTPYSLTVFLHKRQGYYLKHQPPSPPLKQLRLITVYNKSSPGKSENALEQYASGTVNAPFVIIIA